MIVARITSGLGNQLFQYAAGRALAFTRQTTLALDTSWFSNGGARQHHERVALRAYLPDWREPTATELCWVRGRTRSKRQRCATALLRASSVLRRAQVCRHVQYATDGDFSFAPGFFQLPADTYLDGNWQSEKFFAPVANEIRALLNGYRPSPRILHLAEDMSGECTAFVHLRRGDYVSDPHFAREIGALPVGYYENAISLLRTQVGPCRLFVFSDDAHYDMAHLGRLAETVFIPPSMVSDASDVIYLMSKCRHAVMANSSLSWWGAWVSDSPTKFVVAPSPWFADSWRNTRDLLPPRWHSVLRAART